MLSKKDLELLVIQRPSKAVTEETEHLSQEQLKKCLKDAPVETIQQAFHLLDEENREHAFLLNRRTILIHVPDQITPEEFEQSLQYSGGCVLELMPERIPPTRLRAVIRRHTEECKRLFTTERGNKLALFLMSRQKGLRPDMKAAILTAIASKI